MVNMMEKYLVNNGEYMIIIVNHMVNIWLRMVKANNYG